MANTRHWLLRKRWIIAGVAMVAVCCGLPVAGGAAWLLFTTSEASAGAPYPGVALIDFMHAAWDPLGNPDQLVNVVCDKREKDVLRQVAEYRARLEDYAQRENTAWKFTLGSLSPVEQGDRATLHTHASAEWSMPGGEGDVFPSSRRIDTVWDFELVRQGGLHPGWTVCSFTPPPLPDQ